MPTDMILDFSGPAAARHKTPWQIPVVDHLPQMFVVVLPPNCLVTAPLSADDDIQNATWEDAEWQ